MSRQQVEVDSPSNIDGGMLPPLAVPAVARDAGDDQPVFSVGLSTKGLFGASRTPIAFVRIDPIAGAAFCPSTDDILKRLGGR